MTTTSSTVTVAQAEQAFTPLSSALTPVSIGDTAANVSAALDQLQAWVNFSSGLSSTGLVSSITLTDAGTPDLKASAAQLQTDAGALSLITAPYQLTVTDMGAPSAANVTVTTAGQSAGLGVVGLYQSSLAEFSSIVAGADGILYGSAGFGAVAFSNGLTVVPGQTGQIAHVDAAGDLFSTVTVSGAFGTTYATTLYETARTASGYAAPAKLASFSYPAGSQGSLPVLLDSAGDIFGFLANNGSAEASGQIFEIAKTASGYGAQATLLTQALPSTSAAAFTSMTLDSSGDIFAAMPVYVGAVSDGTSLIELVKTATGYGATAKILLAAPTTDVATPFQDVGNLVTDAAGDLFGLATGVAGGNFATSVFEIAKTATGYAANPSYLATLSIGAVQTGGMAVDSQGDVFLLETTAGPGTLNSASSVSLVEIINTSSGHGTPITLATFGSTSNLSADSLLLDGKGDLVVQFAGSFATSLYELTGVAGEGSAPPAAQILTAAAAATAWSASQISAPVQVSDSAADISAKLDGLEPIAAAGKLLPVEITDSGLPTLSLTAAQLTSDKAVLKDVDGLYGLSIHDSAANVMPVILDGTVNSYLTGNNPLAITLTDAAPISLTLTTYQLNDWDILWDDITNDFTVTVMAPDQGVDGNYLNGLPGHGTTAVFSGAASSYTINPTLNNGYFSVATKYAVYSVYALTSLQSEDISSVTALKFADTTDIVASQAPIITGGQISSYQITTLYGAVFGRVPDVDGLSYYETYAARNPVSSFISYAEWFLLSPEYAGNSAHTYAQTTAGETQFITDTYQNLLHRTPSASEISFYLDKVITPIEATPILTPPGVTSALPPQLVAHATTIAYFSQSPEFLSDVQVTAQSPSSSSHWLLLVS